MLLASRSNSELMKNFLGIEFSGCMPVNYLWPKLNDNLGTSKAKEAVSQALDQQLMNGDDNTIPVLLFETCGIALVQKDLIYEQTGLLSCGSKTVLILSIRYSCFQLIREI